MPGFYTWVIDLLPGPIGSSTKRRPGLRARKSLHLASTNIGASAFVKSPILFVVYQWLSVVGYEGTLSPRGEARRRPIKTAKSHLNILTYRTIQETAIRYEEFRVLGTIACGWFTRKLWRRHGLLGGCVCEWRSGHRRVQKTFSSWDLG